MRFISVIIPCYNEEKYIQACIDSIVSQDYEQTRMEVFFIDGMSRDDTRNIIANYSKRYSFIKMLDNTRRIVPSAMNIGIRKSVGDYIIRLDAHSIYPTNYFSSLVEYADKLNSDNVGGIWITDVKNKTPKSLAIKEVLSNRVGVGNALFRIGAKSIVEVDTVPFGCFRSDVFDRFGFYDERLKRDQDIELNKRIKRGGGKLFLVPDIQCTYFARETFKDLIQNNFQNGLWNILTVYFTKKIDSLSFRHFIPLLFILSLIVPTVLAIGYFPIIMISVASFLFYILSMLAISIYLYQKKHLSVFYLFLSFFFLHTSYGMGSLNGIVKVLVLKLKTNQSGRDGSEY